MEYKFVACPWGHGLDTYRTWEVLLLGSFPVVRSSTLDSLYEGLPVVIVKSWTDVSDELLESKYREFVTSDSMRMEKLFFAWWRREIRLSQQLGTVAQASNTHIQPE
jgi:hypothetical protein